MKKFLLNPVLLGTMFVIWVAVVGPFLMSAASTIAVLLNFVIMALMWFWFYKCLKHWFAVPADDSKSSINPTVPSNKE